MNENRKVPRERDLRKLFCQPSPAGEGGARSAADEEFYMFTTQINSIFIIWEKAFNLPYALKNSGDLITMCQYILMIKLPIFEIDIR
ncbi:MAG: hypothetical protein KH352_04595 [Ruminococcus sp.]|nr:hypothetical protein [Candidatus Apopatosoma intestinale]